MKEHGVKASQGCCCRLKERKELSIDLRDRRDTVYTKSKYNDRSSAKWGIRKELNAQNKFPMFSVSCGIEAFNGY